MSGSGVRNKKKLEMTSTKPPIICADHTEYYSQQSQDLHIQNVILKSLTFLGITIKQDLKWDTNTACMTKKHFYFLHQLMKFKPSMEPSIQWP